MNALDQLMVDYVVHQLPVIILARLTVTSIHTYSAHDPDWNSFPHSRAVSAKVK